MTVARFSHLTDAELVRHFEPAILTPLEAELLRRLDRLAILEPLGVADADDAVRVVDMIKVAEEFSCHDATDLRAKLERGDKFYDLAQDLQGDVLTRLADLVREHA